MRYIILPLLFCLCLRVPAQSSVSQTLWLNYGTFVAVDSVIFPALAWNDSPVFSRTNTTLRLQPGDTLLLTLINQDSRTRGFRVRGLGQTQTFAPGDTLRDTLVFDTPGVWLYEESYQNGEGVEMGAAGMIAVGYDDADGAFYWNVREIQSSWCDSLDQGLTPVWAAYNPDYYLVNGNGKPQIETDTTAWVVGAVGDTLRVIMGNTGRGVHSMHLHGYHARILWSSHNPAQVGWDKDTFALWPFETMVIEIVPDKPGEYPVHDHNLIATSGGGYTPNGIMMMQMITP